MVSSATTSYMDAYMTHQGNSMLGAKITSMKSKRNVHFKIEMPS